MYIILGGTGHIGNALSRELIQLGKDVTIITHDKDKVGQIEGMGAVPAVADVMDTETLHQIFSKAKTLFCLNPPADITKDTAVEERKSVNSILEALKGTGIERIVAESTYGAQPGDRIGDLAVLYEMEQGLKNIPANVSIIRAAYYYSNWDGFLESAKNDGKIYSMYPPDFKIPMVAPADIAAVAARLLTSDSEPFGPHYVTGPEDYSANDVAQAFAAALGKKIEIVHIPEQGWDEYLMNAGFSDTAARSMEEMTRITLSRDYELPDNPNRGKITIKEYIKELVKE